MQFKTISQLKTLKLYKKLFVSFMEMSQRCAMLGHCQKTKTNHTDAILHFEAGWLFLNAYMHYI